MIKKNVEIIHKFVDENKGMKILKLIKLCEKNTSMDLNKQYYPI